MKFLKDKKILVTGAGGFIGGHIVRRLLNLGTSTCNLTATDLKPVYAWDNAIPGDVAVDELDLRRQGDVGRLNGFKPFDAVIHLAADMGGMGFIETHKLDCMQSGLMNFNVLNLLKNQNSPCKVFYSSSACVYPGYLQNDKSGFKTHADGLKECEAYPADPEDGYGWEKLFTERLCRHYTEETGVTCCVGRFHNVYGPNGTWEGGREKAPAAICRKVALAKLTGKHEIEIWGDGTQLRSFMYIDDCLEGVFKLLGHETFLGPVNIGSSELVTINELVSLVENIAGVKLTRQYKLEAPKGVHGRNSNNALIREKLGWGPSITLRYGLEKTYAWVYNEIKKKYNY